jgi:hypothetical protein
MRTTLRLTALATLLSALSLVEARAIAPINERSDNVNPFSGKQLSVLLLTLVCWSPVLTSIYSYVSPVYRNQVLAEVESLKAEGEADLAAKAAKVADVSSFIWISSTSAVPTLSSMFQIMLCHPKLTASQPIFVMLRALKNVQGNHKVGAP